MFNFQKSRFAFLFSLILLAPVKLYTQLVSIHIGIDIAEQSIVDKIKALQNKISDAASKNGYSFDTDLKNDFHITLAKIPTSDKNAIMICEKCLSELVQSTNQLDLTEQLQKGRFAIFPRRKHAWGVWALPTKANDQLSVLANSIEKCLLNAGLQPATYDGYHPHISLGVFKPSMENIPLWIPPLSIKHMKKNPLIITKLHISINIKDESGVQEQFIKDFLLKKKIKNPSQLVQQAVVYPKEEDFGATSLMNAIESGLLNKASRLISDGVDVNARDNKGWTALMFAALYGNSDIVKQLIAAGADVNTQINKWGTTALMLATLIGNPKLIQGGNSDIVQQLIAAKANVNLQDSTGFTALTMAVRQDNVDIVRQLIAAGADPYLKNQKDHNKMAFDYAKAEKKEAIRVAITEGLRERQSYLQQKEKSRQITQEEIPPQIAEKGSLSSCSTM